MFELAKWESSVSALPYYIWKKDGGLPPKVEGLNSGVYLIRGIPLDLSILGYTRLPNMITLEIELPVEKEKPKDWIKDILNLPDLPGGILPHIVGYGYARFLHDAIKFSNNRLFWTLHNLEASELMYRWIESCCTTRCVRCGVSYAWVWPGFEMPAGFIGVRKVSEDVEAIDLIGVSTMDRGRGVGKALVNWALQTSSAKVMMVKTEETNTAALKLYKACGFMEKSTERQYWVRIEK